MPLGTIHEERGLLLRAGPDLVLSRDLGGTWRLDVGRSAERYVGRRVAITGIRDGFDLLAVTRLTPVLSDAELWAVAAFAMPRHGSDAPRFVASRIGALVLAGDVQASASATVAHRVVALGLYQPAALNS